MEFEYDVFISHASEDKEEVAEPLAKLLTSKECKVWYDKTALTIGDNLRRKIEEGLSKSRFGIVILSPSFFRKQWPQLELDGLFSREMADAAKVILPVWHKVTSTDVREFSTPLSIRLGGSTEEGIEKLANDLLKVIKPGEHIETPAVKDELSLCKQAMLTIALRDGVEIYVMPATMQTACYVSLAGNAFAVSEKQRKLFLFALEQLTIAGLVEKLSESVYELTYPGIQAAERMNQIDEPLKLGT